MPKAILHHAYLLFTFRHDGTKLPRSLGLPILLLILSGLSSYIRLHITGSLAEEEILLLTIATTLGVGLAGLAKPALLAAFCIIEITGNVFASLLVDIYPLKFAASMWQMAAFYYAFKTLYLNREPREQ